MMKIFRNKEIKQDLWKKLERNSDFANPFHTIEFYDSFQGLNDVSADVFASGDDNEYFVIAVVILQKERRIRGYFSRRGIIYGGLLISKLSAEKYVELLLRYLKSFYKKRLIYLETRNMFDYAGYRKIFSVNGWEYVPYLNFHLICNDKDHIWKNLNRRRRREIKIAKENNTVCSTVCSVEELESVYRIIEDLYMNKIRKPVLPIEFFLKFFKSGNCKVVAVKSDNRIIGGIICAIYEGKAVYGWYGAGLEKEFSKNSPVVMGIYSAIEYACGNGFEYYDFMGAGQPGQKYGVRKFKEEFGGTMVEHGRFLVKLNPCLYFIGKLVMELLSTVKK